MGRHRIVSKMKRIEMIVEAGRLEEYLPAIGHHATGYTVVPVLAGSGEHGHRSENENVLVITVVSSVHLDPLIDEILPLLNERANIALISDVTVLRAEHFIPEVRAAQRQSAT